MGDGVIRSPLKERSAKAGQEQGRRNLAIGIAIAFLLAIGLWYWRAGDSGLQGGVGLVSSLQEEKVSLSAASCGYCNIL
jgi:hypothetical protein